MLYAEQLKPTRLNEWRFYTYGNGPLQPSTRSSATADGPRDALSVKILSNAAKAKGKVFPYSLLSVGPGAHPGVQAVSPQVT